MRTRLAATLVCAGVMLAVCPQPGAAQDRWSVTVVRATASGDTICTNQTFSFDLTGSTGSHSTRICNADVSVTVEPASVTFRVVGNISYFGCTFNPVSPLAGTGAIAGHAVADTTFSGRVETRQSRFCNTDATVTVTFRAARTVLTAPPSITTHPSHRDAPRGAVVTFSCAASGNPAPTFRWQRLPASGGDWADLANAGPFSGVTTTTMTMTVPMESSAVEHGDRFRCVATNSLGSAMSDAATFLLHQPAFIAFHPNNATVAYGATATFTAAAGGLPAPTYRWQRLPAGSGTWVPLTDTGSFGGTQTATLTVTAESPGGGTNGDQYRVIATNTLGSAPSRGASLTVYQCAYTVSLAAGEFPGGGGEGRVSVTTAPAGLPCQWTATSHVSWIRLRESAGDVSGSNTGAVAFDVLPNLAAAGRIGTLAVGTRTLTVTQAPGRIEWLDPNPVLVNHRTRTFFNSRDIVAADAAAGRLPTRTGTSTDGVSLLVLSVASEHSLTITLADNEGRLEHVDGATSSTFQPGGAPGDRRVVALYRPPARFTATTATRTVTVEITSPLEPGARVQVVLRLERPPLVLVHGQWDSPALWESSGFARALRDRGFRTTAADYRVFSATSFDPTLNPHMPARRVQRAIEVALEDARLRGTAAAQVDVVAHSMGGLVTRALLQQPDCPAGAGTHRFQCYRHVSNLYRGWIRRLITIGTPHNGSPAAKVLYDNRLVEIPVLNPLTGVITPVQIKTIVAAAAGSLEGGSALALTPGSAAYARLLASPGCGSGGETMLPTYGLVGDYRPLGADRTRTWVVNMLISQLANRSIDEVFGEASDLAVGVSSQWGRGAGATIPLSARFSNTVHSAALGSSPSSGLYAEAEHPAIRDRVVELLDSDGSAFGCFSKPWAPAAAQTVRAVPPATVDPSSRAMRFTSPSTSAVITHGTGMRLTLTVEPVNGADIRNLVFTLGGVLSVAGPQSAPFTTVVDLPADLPLGPLSVVAVATDAISGLIADMRTVTVVPGDTPSAIRATPSTLTLSAGDAAGEPLTVMGTFSRGSTTVELDVTASALGTRYVARRGGAVVTVTAEGVVTAAGAGRDVIDISTTGGLTTSVEVAVECAIGVTPETVALPAGASTGTLTIATAGGTCPWTVTSSADWLTLEGTTTGTGDGIVTFRATANPTIEERTGTLHVAGQTIVVVQSGAVCAYSVSPETTTVASTGGDVQVNVTTFGGCRWTVSSDAAWISLPDMAREWAPVAAPPASQFGAAAGTVGDRLIVASGLNSATSSPTDAVRIFTRSTGVWSVGAAMPQARYGPASGVIDGKLYVAGGQATSNRSALHIYDVETNAWSTGESMPLASSAMAGAVINGKLYVVGGMSPENSVKVDTLRVYDPAAPAGSRWSVGPPVPTPRAFPAAVVVDGKLVVIGGTDNAHPFANFATGVVEIFDPVAGTWSRKASMPTPRFGLVAAAAGGLVYAMGGTAHGTSGTSVLYTRLATTEIYDVASDTWTTGPAMPTEHALGAAGVLADAIHVVGGDDQAGPTTAHHRLTAVAGSVSSGSTTIRVAAHTAAQGRTATVTVAGRTVTIVQRGHQPSSLSVAPSALRFAATKTGASGDLVSVTGAQPVVVNATGSPSPQWTATSRQPWVVIGNGSGTGAGTFTVRIANPGNVIGGASALDATITIAAPNAGMSATVSVVLTVQQSAGGTSPAVGQVDTPAQHTTGAQGAVAMTGWVVDDVGVQHVRIYRQCLVFDLPAACQDVLGSRVVFVGEAAVIAGARPDVEALYPTMPAANAAGWGFLILSNLLPHIPLASASGGGVGTFTFSVVATDMEGNQTLLGRDVTDRSPTVVTVANDTIAKPFGAIDTPGQGATVSGTLHNFGWVLTPDPGTGVLVPISGSTITVFIDGAPIGAATYDLCRGSVGNPVPSSALCDDDVSTTFRAGGTTFRNLDAGRGPIALRTLSTSALTNGLHTISWGVTDSAGRSEGIGSRYFNVLNAAPDGCRAECGVRGAEGDVGLPYVQSVVLARTGYDLRAAFTALVPDDGGTTHVRIPELGRVELRVPGVVDGWLVVNGERRALPIGVGVDVARGVITWAPGPGYLGTYPLTFVVRGAECGVRSSAGCEVRVDVTIGGVNDPPSARRTPHPALPTLFYPSHFRMV